MPEAENNAVIDKLDEIAGLLRDVLKAQAQPRRRLVRLRSAAAYYSVSVGTIRTLIQKGALPIVKIHDGNRHTPHLIDLDDLDELIQRSKF